MNRKPKIIAQTLREVEGKKVVVKVFEYMGDLAPTPMRGSKVRSINGAGVTPPDPVTLRPS